jgi:uncharacterized protein with PQ loop repeat
MTGTSSLDRLQKLQEDLLNLVDLPSSKAVDFILQCRPQLKLEDLSKGGEPDLSSNEHLECYISTRAFTVEVFQTLFDVHELLSLGKNEEKLQALRTWLIAIQEEGLIESILKRLEQIDTVHQKQKSELKPLEESTTKSNDKDQIYRYQVALDSLFQERITLATLVYSSVCFAAPSTNIIKNLVSLSSKLIRGDTLTIPIFLSCLASVRVAGQYRDSVSSRSIAGTQERRKELSSNSLKELSQYFGTICFQQPGLKNALSLAIVIAEAGLRRENSDTAETRKQEQAALQSDALAWMISQVLSNLSKPYDPLATGIDTLYRSFTKESVPITTYLLDERLQDFVHFELQFLATNMIKRMGKVLAELRKSDDTALVKHDQQSGDSSQGAHHATPNTNSAATQEKNLLRSDFELVCLFLSLLFESRPNDCAVFWSGETSHTTFGRFLQLGCGALHRRLQTSCYNLIATLVNDQPSAAKVYQDIQTEYLGSISWNGLFSGLEYYVKGFKKLGSQASRGVAIGHPEVELLYSLLRILRQVVRYDENARKNILSGSNDALLLLFDLFTCSIPVRLKASVLASIAAFVSPDAPLLAEDLNHIAQRVWSYMESVALVPQVAQSQKLQHSGIKQELEEREIPMKQYPLTNSYLELLENLTPSPFIVFGNNELRKDRMFHLVDNLGAPNREPGLYPYFDYLIKEVFLKAELREYHDSREFWAQWASSLGVLYNALIDLDSLISEVSIKQVAQSTPSIGTSITSPANQYRLLLSHPAFAILCDILDGRQILDGVLRVVSKGREVFELEAEQKLEIAADIVRVEEQLPTDKLTEFSAKLSRNSLSEDYQNALLLAFRIIHQVLMMQSKFLHEVLPSLRLNVSSKRELDRLLATRQHALVDLIFFIKSPSSYKFMDDLGLLSVKILAALSQAPTYAPSNPGITNSLVAILSSSNLSTAISSAYQERFSAMEAELDPISIGPADDVQIRSVKLAMLKLLALNLRGRATPSIAHFLLGLTKDGRLSIQDPSVANTSLFRVITRDLQNDVLPLPLAEVAQELIYDLLSNQETFPISSILKSSNFFDHQIQTWLIPDHLNFAFDSNMTDGASLLKHTLGATDFTRSMMSQTPSKAFFGTPVHTFRRKVQPFKSVTSKDAAVISFNIVTVLGIWSWLLQSISIQVKVNHDQRSYVQSLIRKLFKEPLSRPAMLEVLRLAMNVGVPVFSDANFEAFYNEIQAISAHAVQSGGWPTIVEASGCTVYDIKACERMATTIVAGIPQLASQSVVDSTPRSPGPPGVPPSRLAARSQAEASVVEGTMAGLIYENKQRRIFDAKVKFLKAWIDLASVCLLTNSSMFGTSEEFCDVLKLLITTVTEYIKVVRTECREYFSKILLLLLALLCRTTSLSDMDHLLLTQTLRVILETIKAPDSNIVVRGNLYTCLLVYLSYTCSNFKLTQLSGQSVIGSFTASNQFGRSTLGFGFSTSTFNQEAGMDKIESSNLIMLRNQGGDGLLEHLCRDAINGGIWQAAGLSLLDALVDWSGKESKLWVFEYLYKHNHIQTFAGAIRDLGPNLLHLCSSDDTSPAELAKLFIYESLMSLLMRLALNKARCSLLVEGNVVAALADCNFFSYRVGISTSAAFRQSISPGSTAGFLQTQGDPYSYFSTGSKLSLEKVSQTLMRYNQVLQPALDLIVTICSVMNHSTDKSHEGLMKSVSHFISSHLHSFVRILRACLNLCQDRVPKDDDDYELGLLKQVNQIACIVSFLAKDKIKVPPELSELLLLILLRFTRAEFLSHDGPSQAEKYMINTSSFVINYCFALISESNTMESNDTGNESDLRSSMASKRGPLASPMKESTAFGNESTFTNRSRFLFDPDLAAAKDRYYSATNRITLGLLVLFMNQVITRLRGNVALEKMIEQKQSQLSQLTVDDWTTYVVRSMSSDISSFVSYESIPESKRIEIFTRQLSLRLHEVMVETGSYLRMLEVAMTVLFLHVRHYTSMAEGHNGATSEMSSLLMDTTILPSFNDVPSTQRLSQRLAINLSNLKIDAASVLPDLEKSITSIEMVCVKGLLYSFVSFPLYKDSYLVFDTLKDYLSIAVHFP